jgi:hypothetical protein
MRNAPFSRSAGRAKNPHMKGEIRDAQYTGDKKRGMVEDPSLIVVTPRSEYTHVTCTDIMIFISILHKKTFPE